MKSTFDLPYTIASLIANQPRVTSNGQKLIRADLINLLNQLYYAERYEMQDESNVMYYDTTVDNSYYPISTIGNLIAVEPKDTDISNSFQENYNTLWLMIPYDDNFNKSRLIIMGNAILRTNFDLTNLVDVATDHPYEPMLMGKTDKQARRTVESLAKLYKTLLRQTNELDAMKTAYSAFNDNYYTDCVDVISTAMALATLEATYNFFTDSTLDDVIAADKDLGFGKLYRAYSAYIEASNRLPTFPTRRPTGNDPVKIRERYIEILQNVAKFFLTNESSYLRNTQIIANLIARIS